MSRVTEAPGAARLRASEGLPRNGSVVHAIVEQALAVPESGPLASLDEACRLLAGCRDLEDVRKIRDMAEAARLYARAIDRGLEAQNHAAEIKLRAERRAGELLTGIVHPGNPQLSQGVTIGRIPDGITRAQSSRWQAEAAVPLPMFEQHIADVRESGGELTSAGVLKIAKPITRATRAPVHVAPPTLARPARVTLLVGDVRTALAQLPAESVQTVVTSVPYWGLRSYGTVPQVWGGEPGHNHTWDSAGVVRAATYRQGEKQRWQHERNGRGEVNADIENRDRPGWLRLDSDRGDRCDCSAWLGELGNEPTPGLYVEHIVEAFRAVRRVLRADGTVWLNIGFSYAGSGKGPSGWDGIGGDQERRQGFTGEGKKYTAGPASGVIGAPEMGALSRKSVSRHRGGAGPVVGYKPKDLIPIPWLVAIALQQDGWYWRSTIAWCKTACMPEAVTDRPTSAWEPILMLSKSRRYFYDKDAVMESTEGSDTHSRGNGLNPKSRHDGYSPGQDSANMPRLHRIKQNESFSAATAAVLPTRNMRNTWLLGPEPYSGAHFAVFPTEVPRRCILAGSRRGDLVLDPFAGAGTTSMVAARLGRDSIGIELKPEYAAMARDRIEADGGFTVDVSVENLSGGGLAMAPEPVKDKQAATGAARVKGGDTYSGFNARWKAREVLHD